MSDALIVRRGGSGLSPNSAVIHVVGQTGSTITFSKGGVVAKVLPPEKAHVNAEDNTLADWYYAVSSGNYGEWTVTATLGSDTSSKTVIVDSNKQYDLELLFNLWFIKNGVIQDGVTHEISPTGPTLTSNYEGLGYARWYKSKPSGWTDYFTVVSPIHDFVQKPYSTLKVDFQIIIADHAQTHAMRAGIGDAVASSAAQNWFAYGQLHNAEGAAPRQTADVDISAVNASGYLKLRISASSSSQADIRFFNIWME